MIQLAVGPNAVTYTGPAMALQDALAPVWGYVTYATRWNWLLLAWDTPDRIVPGEHWAINMSQACTIENFKWWYVQIAQLILPASAAPGETVQVEVVLVAHVDWMINIACTGRAGVAAIDFPPYEEWPGRVYRSMLGYFTMPSEDVAITVWGFYWDFGTSEWVWDSTAIGRVAVGPGEPVTYDFSFGTPVIAIA